MTMPFFDPRLLSMPQGQQPPAPQPQQRPNRSILDRVFGTPGASGLVDEDVIRQARQRSLLNAGLSLMASGAPKAQRTSLGEGLYGALQAGQQAYDNTVSGAVQAEQMRQQQEMQQEVEKIRQGFVGRAPTRENLSNMALQIAAARGDLGPMAALLAATQPEPTKLPELEFRFDDTTGVMGAYNKNSGELVRATRMRSDGTTETMNDNQVRWLDTLESGFRQETAATADQMQAVGRFLGSVRQIQEAMDAGTPEQAAWAVHALTMAFGKVSDPGSVVREFEAAGIKDAGSLLQRADMLMDRLLKGTITPDMLNSVARNVALQVEGQKTAYDAMAANTRNRAKARGIESWLRLPDLYGGFTEDLERAKQGWSRKVKTDPWGIR